jgi:spermidine/putrescine transport system substrate-binding protein
MMEQRKEQAPGVDASLLRGLTQRRMSRRNLIKYMGVSAGALSLSSILAACAGDDGGTTPGTSGGGNVFQGEPAGELDFANWPLYIDKAKDAQGDVYYPSVRGFEKETGIQVNYQEIIQDNASFFGKLQPQLQAGQDTGWDIIVITDGQQFTALTQNEWVTPLDPTKRPNFDANAAGWAKDPNFDPGNKYSMAWQSGLTGIGYNTELVNSAPKTMDDLANPDIVGTNSVGMLTGDMANFVMINLGIDPLTSGPAEWKEAAAWLQMQKESGTVRQYYDQGYFDDLSAGNLAATMAWSGDVLYSKVWLGEPHEFFVPTGGALLWIDNMLIPANAAHPVDAITMMDYVYQPEVAQLITEWVLYMSPVPAVQDLIAKHAQEQLDKGVKGYGNKLELTATSPFLWPEDSGLLDQTSFGRNLETDEEREEWNATFLPISES